MDHYYTIAEVSEQTGFPKRTLYDAVKSGKLRVALPNGSKRGMRTTAAWVNEWLSRSDDKED